MKKHITLIIAAIMILGSIKAMAMSDSEIDRMNTDGKIEAAIADQSCSDCADFDLTEGKIGAAAAMNMRLMLEESQKKVDEISRMGDMVGNAMEDSQGLLKFIGEKETFAEMALNEMKALEKKADSMETDALLKASSRMAKLSTEIRALNEETQVTLDKVLAGR